MKKIVLIFILTVQLFSMDWLKYNEALDIKDLVRKPLFIMVGSNNCKFCNKFKEKVENNKSFQDYLNGYFLPVYINKDREILPDNLMTPVTPMFFIVDYKSMKLLVDPAVGNQPLDKMFDWLDKVSKVVNKLQGDF